MGKQKLLVLGSTGLLGRSLIKVLSEDFEVYGMAHKSADFNIDITDDNALIKVLKKVSPTIIINTVAIVDHSYCESNPAEAYMVNTRPITIINDYIKNSDCYFIQISTDHYYKNDLKKKHTERHPVVLTSEYSKTKFLAEQLTLLNSKSLVLRTNIVGFKRNFTQASFVDWVFDSLSNHKQITLFDDFYTSSIHTVQLAKILKKIISKRIPGILNIASSEVVSKKKFIEKFASKFELSLKNTLTGSCKNFKDSKKKGDSLGLDTSKAEKILGYPLPNLDEVIDSLFNEYLSRFDRRKK
ncbi:sugar nucleotide-binding protein [Desulfobacula sp.]|uniref:sugar nucleotide-binding protein n=1 Tax=Desulfobacula sp. TaxID=2593537 RepID=UPI002624D15B|nr:sugar nucleotide-binding protein [Desulfobacula sp.]